MLRRLAPLLAACALVTALGAASTPARAATSDRYQVAAQGAALAPNAGGQQAYSLKLSHADWEAGLFSNQYITAGSFPLSGGSYDWRFPICDDQCFWQFFAQVGAGISTGGPLAEITWGAVIPLVPLWLPVRAPPYLPALRIDITTQMIFIRWRAVTWSYPLWVGLSVPF